MTTQPETYHEEVLDHLRTERAKANDSINTVSRLQDIGQLFTTQAKTDLINAVVSAHPGCSVCANYQGNARP